MKLIMFDIDGTLTRTEQADEVCFVQALDEVFGFTNIDTDWASYPHCSDSGILEELFQRRLRRSPFADEIITFQSHFLQLLTESATTHGICPIEGACDFVSSLSRHPDFAVSLASGGWECSARLKLQCAGFALQQTPAAFADAAHSREQIMQTSFTRAALAYSRDSFDGVIYIGDGVWDARASKNLHYPFIGIASDPTRRERLFSEGAAYVFSDYSDPVAFLDAFKAQ